MLDYLRKQPLIGLTLAVAGGLVLAHAINELADYLWMTYFWDFVADNGWMLFDISVIAIALTISARSVWKRVRARTRQAAADSSAAALRL